jgi:transcription elongation factor GreA
MATIDKFPMLAEGHAKLSRQLKQLREVERPEIVEAIEEARAHGDLSENAEYHAAKERQGQIEAQIADLEAKLARAVVIDPTTLSGDKVVFGATVNLLDEDDKPVTFQIVGEAEADAKVGRISFSSPVGRALIGRSLGEEVEVVTPSGDRSYVIDRVEFR